MRSHVVRVLVVLALLATPVAACLWDYDTLRDERRGLPGIAEVLAGRWEKHSPFFYQRRVEQMNALITREPSNLAAYDNLAVAQEKLGDIPAAIATMRRKEAIKPGEYTTHANLGTFHLHAGDLDQGIEQIRKALALNPAAHFGREEYQLKLAEFLRDRKRDPAARRYENFLGISYGEGADVAAARRQIDRLLAAPSTAPTTAPMTEPAHLDEGDRNNHGWLGRGSAGKLRDLELKDNVFDGLIGMTRFGTGTSAEVYLTLGDLLALRGDKALAYRAYQRALDFGHPRAEYLRGVMKSIREVVHDSSGISPETIAGERAAADVWVKAFQDYEDGLLRAGKDVNDESVYAAFYAGHGKAQQPEALALIDLLPKDYFARQLTIVILAVVGGLLALIVVYRTIRRASRRRSTSPAV